MANEKISALPSGAPTQPGDAIPIARGGSNYSLAASQLIGLSAAVIGGNTAGVTASVSSGTLFLAGGNNVTLSQNANSITISANTAAAANLSVSAGTTTGAFGGLTFSNSNNVSFGLNNGTITGSAAAQASFFALGNTTQNSSSVLSFSALSLNGLGEVTVGYSNGSIQISAPSQSAGVSTGGNTSGNTGTYSGQLILAGGNNITLSVSSAAGGAQTITISGANAGGAQTGISGVQVSNTTYTSGTVTFQNANGASFGSSGANGVSLSYTVPTQASFFALGNTTQNSSSVVPFNALSLNGLGEISVGYSNGSIQISAPPSSVGVSTGGNTLGNTGVYSGQVVFAGGNNITLSVSSAAGGAQTITISGPNAGGAQTGISGLQVSNTTYTSGTVTFQNANGISFGSSGAQGISASYSVPTAASFYAVGNTTQNSSSVLSFSALSFDGLGGATVGYSNGSIQISAPTQITTGAGYLQGNTTAQSSSSTFALSSFNVSAAGIASVGWSASTLVISCPASVGLTQSLYATSNTTQSSSGTTSIGSLLFAGAGLVSVGVSNGTVVVSGSAISSASLFALGNTTQNSSTVLALSQMSLNGLGEITVGYSNGSIQISAPSQSAGVSTGGNTSGNTGVYSGQLILAGGNNITLSVSSAAGGAQTITISGGVGVSTGGLYALGNTTQNSSTTLALSALSFNGLGNITIGYSNGSIQLSGSQSNQNNSLFALGNTTQNSSTFMNASVLSFNGLGAQTVGFSNGSIQLSVPNTSSLVGTNGISVSTNGSTISVSLIGTTAQYFEPPMRGQTTSGANAVGTVYVYPFDIQQNVSMVRLQMLQQITTQLQTTMSVSGSVSAGNASSGTGSWAISGTVELFSRQSTGTAANSSNLLSFFSNTYSYGLGMSESVSWSTNASSATVSFTTSGAISYIASINSTGGASTASFGTSGSSSFSSTSNGANSFSSSFAMTFASSVLGGIAPVMVPFGTSLSPGEYFLGHIQSSNSGSTNYALQGVLSMSPGMVHYSTNTSGYREIGATTTNASSNFRQGLGSYSSSGNTTTTLALTAISGFSQSQLWFNMMNATK